MLRAMWLIVRKDLTVEVRSREIAYTTLFFAVSCVLVFAFSLVREGRAAEGVGAGVLWLAILFAGNLALGRTFERERQSETLRALMLAPASRPAVYLGKLTGIILLLAGTEIVLVPLVALLFEVRPTDAATFIGAALFLVLIAAAASLVPAWRATRVAPVTALHTE